MSSTEAAAAGMASPRKTQDFGPFADQIEQQIRSLSATLNDQKAIGLALSSPRFQLLAQEHDYEFSGVLDTWSSSIVQGSVAVRLNDVSLVYSYNDTSIVITEDPLLTKVTNITIRDDVLIAGSSSRSVSTPGHVSPNFSPDFSISASPTSFFCLVGAGCSKFSTITLTSLNGFAGTVNLSATQQNWIIANIASSVTLTSGGSTSTLLDIEVSNAASAGVYSVSVAGTSGSLSHSTTVSLTVGTADFTVNTSPSVLNIGSGGPSATSTVTSNSVSGFSGTVSLSTSVGGGISSSVNPSAVTLASGGSGSSTLSVSVPANTPSGTFSDTVTATSGGLSHSSLVTINVCNPSFANNNYWSGYQITGGPNSCNPTPVYEAEGQWIVPAVSQPSSGCQLVHCDLAMWTGLVNNPSAAIVQGGTDSGLTCFITCSNSYYAFVEFAPNTAMTCSNVGSQGDLVRADVLNHAANGGRTDQFDVIVTDLTNGNACSSTNQTFNIGTPYYAEFIDERPVRGTPPFQAPARLPQFVTASMAGVNLIDICTPQCHQQNIRDMLNAGWYQQITMQNSDATTTYQNIQVSFDTSCGNCGVIDQQWNTSQGT